MLSHERRRGVTLIEVIVVIVIISLLLGLSIALYRNVAAQTTGKCRAVNMPEHKSRLPWSGVGETGNGVELSRRCNRGAPVHFNWV